MVWAATDKPLADSTGTPRHQRVTDRLVPLVVGELAEACAKEGSPRSDLPAGRSSGITVLVRTVRRGAHRGHASPFAAAGGRTVRRRCHAF